MNLLFEDLFFIPNLKKSDRVFLIDDIEEYVKPEQKSNWIPIDGYNYPYPDDDSKLTKIIEKLSQLQ